MGFVDSSGLVLSLVIGILMNVYELRVSGRPILSFEIDSAPWLPVKPRIRTAWLRYLISSAIRRHFRQSAAVVTA